MERLRNGEVSPYLTGELRAGDERRHEPADLEDYEVLDASDTLDGSPGVAFDIDDEVGCRL